MNILNTLNVINTLNTLVFFDNYTEEQISKILLEYSENLLHFRNFWTEGFISIGFGILKFIYGIGKFAYDSFDSIFGFMNLKILIHYIIIFCLFQGLF